MLLATAHKCKPDWMLSQAMGSIHGVLPGGQVITNVDVFRKLYEVVGLGWVYSITKFGPINKIANRYRLPPLTAEYVYPEQWSCTYSCQHLCVQHCKCKQSVLTSRCEHLEASSP